MAGIDLLNVNLSVIYQIILFWLTLLVVSRWLILPVSKTLALRNARLQPVATSSGLEEKITQKEEEYAAMLKNSRAKSMRLRQGVREEAVAKEREVLSKAHDSAMTKLGQARDDLAKSLETARGEIVQWIPQHASLLARKILGRELS